MHPLWCRFVLILCVQIPFYTSFHVTYLKCSLPHPHLAEYVTLVFILSCLVTTSFSMALRKAILFLFYLCRKQRLDILPHALIVLLLVFRTGFVGKSHSLS